MSTSTITSKGQITIPAAVRASLGVTTGDRVEFIQIEAGRYELVAATLPVQALKGLIKKPSKPVSIDEMNNAIAMLGAKAK
jgi:antitoxin PrlF